MSQNTYSINIYYSPTRDELILASGDLVEVFDDKTYVFADQESILKKNGWIFIGEFL